MNGKLYGNDYKKMIQHANENEAASLAAVSYARQLAARGLAIGEIEKMVGDVGYRLPYEEMTEIWSAYQKHNDAFLKAMRAGA